MVIMMMVRILNVSCVMKIALLVNNHPHNASLVEATESLSAQNVFAQMAGMMIFCRLIVKDASLNAKLAQV
jgi:hypothetical protein